MTDTSKATGPKPEGWGLIRPGDRKSHYYVDTLSLCGRVGFYVGPLDPDDEPSPDDHAECRKKLDARNAKAARAAAGK